MNIREIRPPIRREVIVNRGDREWAIAKGRAANIRDFKAGAGFAPSNTRIGTQLLPPQLCQRCFLSLSIRGYPSAFSSHRNRNNAGRCFINTPIVNCYHLIKSHFPRAFHDSADQEERLLRRSVIKTAALVPRLVCSLSAFPPLSLSLCPSFSFSVSVFFFLFLYLFQTIMKSLTSTSIDPLDGNVYPSCEKLRDHA